MPTQSNVAIGIQNKQSQKKSTHQSLKRAIAVLRLFSEAEPSLSVAEVSQKLGLHKSTASRILGVLLEEGLLEMDSENGRYSPGIGLITLAGVALGQIDVRSASLPSLETLVEISNETVTTSIFKGKETIAVAHMPSPQSVRYAVWIGRRTNFHSTASGKIYLANISEERRLGFLFQTFVKATPSQQIKLNNDFRKIQSQGHAIEIDEFEQGISAIAAPIFDFKSEIKAAISIAGPTYRLSQEQLEKFARPLQEQAYLISERLGFNGTYPFK
ncbi:MAG: IclR family transcriptional regulator [Chloroflexota bacterium]